MTIWLLAVIVLASTVGLGFRQGAIKAGFSFFGIIVGALLAVPLGRLLGRVLGMIGMKDPLLVWALGPVLVFILISIIFKVAAAPVHEKVDVYFKYKTGDLRQALWERLNHQLGLCVGVLNGTAYLILLVFLISVPSYMTYQVASGDKDPTWMRLLNRLGEDLQSTGMAKVARSINSIPQVDYDMADLVASLYRNPLAEARVSGYPAFLGLSELSEFQSLANDRDFTEAWQRQEPVATLMAKPSFLGIRNNPALLKTIWTTVEENQMDFRTYLATGKSPKYDPIQILGRWRFDVSAAIVAMRRAKPNIPSSEMVKMRKYMEAAFAKTRLVAKPDQQITIRDVPGLKAPGGGVPAGGLQTLQGQWQDLGGGKYQLTLSGMELPATVEGERLGIKANGMELVFNPEQ
ncbi:MAG TPA: CvpA family protein [Candidatus Acidoferrum sp.]|nr:CvpA family protein [Candidatus Acidoferrum sp.]